METTTTRYLPGVRPAPRLAFLTLDQVVIDEAGEPPSEGLRSSVQAMGLQQSLLVQDRDDGTYYVVAGRRRTLAAREAELEQVPAIIYPSSMSREEILAARLTENEHRGRNPLGEYEAVKALLTPLIAEGHQDPLGVVCSELRLRRSRLEDLLKLDKLIPELLAAWKARRLTFGLAQEASRLAPERQRKVLEAAGDGKIIGNHIYEATRAVRTEGHRKLLPDLSVDPSKRNTVSRGPVPVSTGEDEHPVANGEPVVGDAGTAEYGVVALPAVANPPVVMHHQEMTLEEVEAVRHEMGLVGVDRDSRQPFIIPSQPTANVLATAIQAVLTRQGVKYADLSAKLDEIGVLVREALAGGKERDGDNATQDE